MSLADADLPLSAELRARTAHAHEVAERSEFMAALAEGRVTRLGLAGLLSRLAPVYAALEDAAASWTGHPVIGGLVLPELHRAARLSDDLRHLAPGRAAPVSPAAVAYAGRIREVARRSAPSFVAHHYTRYLGDLSGGQVIRAAVERTLGVTDGAGSSFFAFPGVHVGTVKREYRQLLDDLPFSTAQREELVAEALVAYRLNAGITRELDRDLGRWIRTEALPA